MTEQSEGKIYFSNIDTSWSNPFVKIRHEIDPSTMEGQEVFRFDDVNGREYMWDKTELYRLIPLKGKYGRPRKNTK